MILDLSDLTSVNLDEYIGLSGENPQSYRYFMQKHLFNQKPFKESFCQMVLLKMRSGSETLHSKFWQSILLICKFWELVQANGHIGFNEPGTSFDSTVHVVDLEQSTIEANARFFDKIEDVLTQAYSMGIRNILDAKSIILFAYGASKAKAIAGTVEGPITEELPGSALQKHEDVVVIADKEALSILKNKNLFLSNFR